MHTRHDAIIYKQRIANALCCIVRALSGALNKSVKLRRYIIEGDALRHNALNTLPAAGFDV